MSRRCSLNIPYSWIQNVLRSSSLFFNRDGYKANKTINLSVFDAMEEDEHPVNFLYFGNQGRSGTTFT